ncbi:MAG: lipid kinase [Chrysiogenales bacterium]|nr:MAG: lipid kinase [Chrysiogenales bacterium]
MKRYILMFFVLVVAAGMVLSCSKKREYSVAWSHYTGWEPWDYADSSGILKKWADKYGITIKLVRVNDYVESINLFTAKKYQACAMTNMDALTIPAAGGIDCTALIIGDFSNGNDGIVTKKEKAVADLAGKRIMLVQNSVSHYLLSRALAMNGVAEKELTVVNTSDADIGSVFLSEKEGIAVTWNPILMQVRKTEGVNMIFDSSKIPGEIIDMLVIHSDAPEDLKKALTGAWYETMALIADQAENGDALAQMAKSSAATVPEFMEQLKTTAMFYKASDAVRFGESAQLKKTMEYVRSFSFDNKLFGESAGSKNFVGIRFPDGTVMGDAANVKLRLDVTYMGMAAEGKL